MIALAALIGGALFLALYVWLGQVVVVALATVCLALVCIGAASDVLRAIEDRQTAYRRWNEWHG